ncbi:MAG: hypothetical protein AAB824_01480 [Patescibacteria group bacterium]
MDVYQVVLAVFILLVVVLGAIVFAKPNKEKNAPFLSNRTVVSSQDVASGKKFKKFKRQVTSKKDLR